MATDTAVKAPRKSRKAAGSTATVAEIASKHIKTPAEAQATNLGSTALTTESNVVVIEPVRAVLSKMTEGWDKSEAKLATDAVQFAITTMTEAKEKLLEIGERFNTLREKQSPEHFRAVLRATASLKIDGLSENNIRLYMERAKIGRLYLRQRAGNVEHLSKALRQQFYALSGTRGFVVRVEPSDEEKKNGIPAHYEVSGAFSKAFDDVPALSPDAKPSDIEVYVRKVAARAQELQTTERKPSQKKDAKQLRNRFASFLERWKADAAANVLYEMFQHMAQETEDLTIAENLIGKMDGMLTGSSKAAKKQAAA